MDGIADRGVAICVATMIIRAWDNQLEIAAPAKVNLFLELFSRREDGYHAIETVMSCVSIFDRLRFTTRRDSKIKLSLIHTGAGQLPRESDDIPTDQRNLILKTLQLVRSIAQQESDSNSCKSGIDIRLEKTIPSAAGLGGASSNAAAALVAANRLWNLNWPQAKLCEIAAQLGSDIAFFLFGGTAICRGRGEIVEPLKVPAGLALVIAKPDDSLSTARVFSGVTIGDELRDGSDLIQGVRTGRPAAIGKQLFNRLQQFAEPLSHQIAIMYREFSRLNCLGHQMSGSGSSYFGVFSNARVARQAAESLSSRAPDVRIFCSQTLSPHQVRHFSSTG